MVIKVSVMRSFSRLCRYVCGDKERAVVLASEGVRNSNCDRMAQDFETQRRFRPSVTKAALHVIMSFGADEQIDDQKMVRVAGDYLHEVGFSGTQYVITRHLDRPHPHVHIIANVIDNEGKPLCTSWIGLKSQRLIPAMAWRHGIQRSFGKNLARTHFECLNPRDANRYFIYQAVCEVLPDMKTLDDLAAALRTYGIVPSFKNSGESGEPEGLVFRLGSYRYSGRSVDHALSLPNLRAALNLKRQGLHLNGETLLAEVRNGKALKAASKRKLEKMPGIGAGILSPSEVAQRNNERRMRIV